jgi:hypothetical protein
MEIIISEEQAFNLLPQFTLEVARDRLEQKKTNLVAGTFGALLSRPKPEEIQIVSIESRLEPFWLINAFTHTVFDRNNTYNVAVGGAEVKSVTLLGQELPVSANAKGGVGIGLNVVEHCVEEHRASYTFDGSGARLDMNKYLACAKNVISDWSSFAPEGTLVVPPQVHATSVVRTVMSDMIKPVQAQVIHSEQMNLESIQLNFRPVYAFEYEWTPKNKRAVLEFDAVTGDIHTGGRKLSNQIKNVLTRDLIFDVTADAVGLLVPGGSIAVKLVKAAIDRK